LLKKALLFFLFFPFSSFLLVKGSVFGDSVTQPENSLSVSEGGSVKLDCSYSTGHSNPDLYWYRQLPDGTLQFILYRDNSRRKDADFTKGRFLADQTDPQKSFPLTISNVEKGDALMYFCALRL
uniref:T cell receptor delta variable 3 n=1 Tax=Latimeria chalumnae TaxID=7897 RepID=H3AJY3_LATCH